MEVCYSDYLLLYSVKNCADLKQAVFGEACCIKDEPVISTSAELFLLNTEQKHELKYKILKIILLNINRI